MNDPQAVVKQYQFGALREHFHRELHKGLDQLHEKHDAFADHIAQEVHNLYKLIKMPTNCGRTLEHSLGLSKLATEVMK